jgi:hypothetical protein
MAENKKSTIISRINSQTDRLFNRVIIFVSGIFASAIFFLFSLKIFGMWGIYLALGSSAALNIYLKKKYPKDFLLNTLNNGLITFNILTVICGIIILVLFFGAVQNALN